MRVISSFWNLFGSLVAVGSLLEDFLEPFGNLGGDFEKTFQKVSEKWRKFAKSLPKATPGSSKTVSRTPPPAEAFLVLFSSISFYCFVSRNVFKT